MKPRSGPVCLMAGRFIASWNLAFNCSQKAGFPFFHVVEIWVGTKGLMLTLRLAPRP